MTTFFMFGKYSQEAVKGVSSERTRKAVETVTKLGGKVNSMYVLMGENDLVLIVEFPAIGEALKASIALNKLTGIAFSTYPAMTVEQFDKLIAGA